MIYGLLESELTGNEEVFNKTQPVGETFKYKISNIIDQGSEPICSTCSTSVFLDWNYNKEFDYYSLFRKAGGTSAGLSYTNLLNYLRKKGLIQEYALVHSEIPLKTAITINGPCLGVLMVRDSNRPDFWEGKNSIGLHGVAIIGWDDKGFIIQNSWGDNWGNRGLTTLPYNRFNEFKELWTIVA